MVWRPWASPGLPFWLRVSLGEIGGEIEELEAQVTSLKKDLVKGHERKQSPNDKSGLGFNSNNKNKSTTHKRKKGQGHVKDPAKIVCFKCKIEGHHVRSCPLKKKPLGEKKQGKRPQDGAHGLPQGQAQGLPRLEERPLPKKDQAKAPVVEKSSEKKEKRRTCYICHEKGHISSFCTIGTSQTRPFAPERPTAVVTVDDFRHGNAAASSPKTLRPCSDIAMVDLPRAPRHLVAPKKEHSPVLNLHTNRLLSSQNPSSSLPPASI
ncbi:hypothetical protein QYE76_054348 [Lolium multiflorum]|uniref:CCHC-type domain-containing protein n=1 Tax=Lolium multiflorum TaxID=4521 RepID=A0AAD8WKW9_LOLMU|nr:hypothetical protein QYE76_054348 [Lolium multiflorum]